MKVKLFRLFVFYIVLSCWIPRMASAEVVNMPDEALAAVVRDKLGLAPDAPITQQALQRLYGLGAPRRLESSRLIKDLTGLEHATALQTLDLLSHAVDDLRPLSGLRQLRYLRLDNNQLSDIAPLSGLWRLADLSLDNNQLSDITPLKSLKQLATLSLSQNQLSDITPLSDLTQLRWLSLDNNQLSDVTPLKGLWRLGYLRLDQNQIRDVTPLKGLKRLRFLRLNNNQIRDVTPIQHLIDSKNVSIRFDGNPIGESPEKANLVIESVTADKTILEPGQTFTLTATLKNRGVGKAEAPIYYRWHRSTHPNIHKMEGSDKVLTGAREEIGEKRTAVRSIVEFKKTEDVSLGTNQSSKQYIALTAPQESGIYYYSVCVESPPNESDESDNCSADVEITVLPDRGSYRPVVRLIHFIPKNKIYDLTTKHEDLKKDMEKVQAFYQCEMRKHGHFSNNVTQQFGKTFNFDEKSYVVRSGLTEQDWLNMADDQVFYSVWDEIEAFWKKQQHWGVFDPATDIYLVKMEGNYNDGIGGTALIGIGKAIVYDDRDWLTIAHELGHTFGLGHNFREAQYMMSYCNHTWNEAPFACDTTPDFNPLEDIHGWASTDHCDDFDFDNRVMSKETADWLDVQRAFNPPQVANDNPTTIEIVEPVNSIILSGTTMFDLVVRYEDNDVLHQIHLYVPVTKAEEFANPHSLKLYNAYTLQSGNTVGNLTYSNFSDTMAGQDIIKIRFHTIDSYGNIALTVHTLIKEERADIDENGEVDQEDVAIVSEIVQRKEPPNDDADVNGDGEVTDADVDLVKQIINMKKDVESPAAPLQVSLLPKETALLANYPNPFNPETWIPYQLAEPADVTLTIYDINGRVVRALDLGHQPIGIYEGKSRAAYWDGRNAVGESVASGVYFYTLTAGDFSATRKLLIRK